MELINEILENQPVFKPIIVDKYVEFDIGGLITFDNNQLDEKQLEKYPNEYLLNLTRDNTQLLFNQVWELETERKDEIIVAKLPKQKFILPRHKRLPKAKPLTKWQQFAKEKGIQKKKKSKIAWDEQLRQWVPLYGFKRTNAEKEKNWLIEVPDNADPMQDQFAKKNNIKSENVAKNELQRLRNIAKARNVKVPRFGLVNPDISSSKELQVAATVAKSSTASLGKFQSKLPKEKEARGISAITPGASTRKRKLQPLTSTAEKNLSLAIVDSVLNKRPKLNIEKAVAKQINQEQVARSEEKKNEGSTSRRSNNKRNFTSKAKKQGKSIKSGRISKKPKSSNTNNKGQRKGKLGSNGRKRR